MINIPVLTLRDVVLVPGATVYLEVGREKTVAALEAAMQDNQLIYAVAQRNPETESPEVEDLFDIGTIAQVKQIVKMPEKVVRVVLVGKTRASLQYMESVDSYMQVGVESCEEPEIEEYTLEEIAMVRGLKDIFRVYAVLHNKLNQQLVEGIMESTDLVEMMYLITELITVHYHLKQEILEENDLNTRYERLAVLLNREIKIMRIQGDISEKVKAQVEENQKEYYLREQIKAIHKELGDEDTETETDRFQEKLVKLKAPKKVKDKIGDELRRFKLVSSNSSESAVIRGYIETLLDMPWKKTSCDNTDILHASDVLNQDHYGLGKVKDRVLECLAVKKLKADGASPIICLVGPPGTGKTSIARSVAKAMNRKYVRICLGGVRDEAEIRGHRRTYVGAMPGRIAMALKSAKVKNPLMLLDEIDKLASDAKSDPASALLEVLDPEQNKHFSDHYIELPLDLSQVLFICTANTLDTIPRPLLDRMEVIHVSGYTENEKFHIAKDHLWKKQCEKNGVTQKQISITDKALATVIQNYTRESGVRGLERKLAALCRKAARQIAENPEQKVRISNRNLKEMLGKPVYQQNMANEKPEIGVVRGLAWTQVGGDTLEIEVAILPGSGKLVLTGKLGDVMKESAQIALTLVKSRVQEHVAADYFEKADIHLHVPEGAVPKDGPSAGITMSTAIYSAVMEQAVRPDLAMTGEVTLRGRVLPIGGLKEKLLAAKAAGIHTVLVPEQNQKDVAELETEITDTIEIKYMHRIEEVWSDAMV